MKQLGLSTCFWWPMLLGKIWGYFVHAFWCFKTLWKSSLDSDDHQFYQYQQNEQLTLIKKQNTAYTDWNQWPGLGQTWICGRAKPINWIPTVSLDNEYPISIKIETIAKTAYIFFHLTHTQTLYHKNVNLKSQ